MQLNALRIFAYPSQLTSSTLLQTSQRNKHSLTFRQFKNLIFGKTMRYFDNKLEDYSGGEVKVDRDSWIQQIYHLSESIVQGFPAVHENCGGGLYVGCAGVGYMFYYLSRNDMLKAYHSMFLEQAVIYSRVSTDSMKTAGGSRQEKVAFLLGESGVIAVSALIGDAVGIKKEVDKLVEKYNSMAEVCMPLNFLRCGSDELFVGRTGYLCGVMNLQKRLKQQVVPTETVQKLCTVIIESGRRYVRQSTVVPLMYAYYNTEYLGAAHGLSSILQMLLSFPSVLKANPESEQIVRKAVDFMLSLEQDNCNYAPAMDEVQHRRPEREELVHWCHGAPGVVYMLARAYKVWGDSKYLDACLRCGELAWQKGLLRKGPGICHGVAGSGYVFLLLYRLTVNQLPDSKILDWSMLKGVADDRDKKHLYRAIKFGEFLFSSEFQQARIPDSPYSLYEGWAGTVCFLSDLLQPDKAEFPFFDVFLE